MDFHKMADIFPLMMGVDFASLCEDIKTHGLLEPIWTFEGKIIDGRNRFRACQVVKVEPRFREWDGKGSLIDFILSLNLHRRHLDESQRGMVAARVATMGRGNPYLSTGSPTKSTNTSIDGFDVPTQSNAAKMLNVGTATVQRARVVIDHGTPELIQAVDEGKMSVTRADKIARLPEPKQKDEIKRASEERATIKSTNPKPKNKFYSFAANLREIGKHAQCDPKEDIIGEEFLRAYQIMEDAITNAKGSKWETTSKEAVLKKLAILAHIAQN